MMQHVSTRPKARSDRPLGPRQCSIPRTKNGNEPDPPATVDIESTSPKTHSRASPAEQIEELGHEFDAIHDDVFAELGDRDARYIRTRSSCTASSCWPPARCCAARALRPLVARRHRGAVDGEDPGEHGDRPQRDARAVGLDERSRHQLPAGTGTPPRPRKRGSTRTTTSTTPSPTSVARIGTSATRSCASTRTSSGTRCICCSRSTTSCCWASSSGASPARPRLRRDPRWREVEGAGPSRTEGDRREGAPADREGLRRLPGAVRRFAAVASGRADSRAEILRGALQGDA